MADAAKGDEYLFKVLVVGEVGFCPSLPPPFPRYPHPRPPLNPASRTAQVAGGKTSLVRRYVYNNFSENYQTTIGAFTPPSPHPPRAARRHGALGAAGADFALKIIRCEDGNVIRLQLWDIAGQERFGNMTRVRPPPLRRRRRGGTLASRGSSRPCRRACSRAPSRRIYRRF